MWTSTIIWLTAALLGYVQAQDATTVSGTTYTECHAHGVTQYCWGPDGDETPFAAADTASITSGPASTATAAITTGQTTAVTDCHSHDDETYCVDGDGEEVLISMEATPTEEAPAEYTNCHAHDDETYCVDPDGNDVLVLGEHAEEHSHPLDESSSNEGQDCHFHAGVEYAQHL
jgi:solute carrier family 39 (zinc transporter), member 1/2/3